MTNGILIAAGCFSIVLGLAAVWWPLALIAAGGMLLTGGLLAEWAAARTDALPPAEDDQQ